MKKALKNLKTTQMNQLKSMKKNITKNQYVNKYDKITTLYKKYLKKKKIIHKIRQWK